MARKRVVSRRNGTINVTVKVYNLITKEMETQELCFSPVSFNAAKVQRYVQKEMPKYRFIDVEKAVLSTTLFEMEEDKFFNTATPVDGSETTEEITF